MSQNAFEPRTLDGVKWREWGKLALTLLKRMGPGWWIAIFTPVLVAAFLVRSVDFHSSSVRLTLWGLCSLLPALGHWISCSIQRGMERARQGNQASVIGDMIGGLDDITSCRWGRMKALTGILTIFVIMGIATFVGMGENAKLASETSLIEHFYIFMFSSIAVVFMLRLRGPLMDFGYHLEKRGATPETAKALSELASARNYRVRPLLNLSATLPIWGWIILNINGLSLLAAIGIFLHFLWLVAMDYIVFLEIFEGGAKVEEMKRVESFQLAQARL